MVHRNIDGFPIRYEVSCPITVHKNDSCVNIVTIRI